MDIRKTLFLSTSAVLSFFSFSCRGWYVLRVQHSRTGYEWRDWEILVKLSLFFSFHSCFCFIRDEVQWWPPKSVICFYELNSFVYSMYSAWEEWHYSMAQRCDFREWDWTENGVFYADNAARVNTMNVIFYVLQSCRYEVVLWSVIVIISLLKTGYF